MTTEAAKKDWFAKRELPRLDINIAVWVYIIPAKEGHQRDPHTYSDDELRRVFAVDLSGGGLCLYFDKAQIDYIKSVMDSKDFIGLTFFIPDPENPTQIKAIAEARWTNEINDGQKEGLNVGLRFVRISPSMKNVIVNWVIKKLIEKGLNEA